MWTENFQMYKLGLEKEEEPHQTDNIHRKGIPEKHLLLLHWLR